MRLTAGTFSKIFTKAFTDSDNFDVAELCFQISKLKHQWKTPYYKRDGLISSRFVQILTELGGVSDLIDRDEIEDIDGLGLGIRLADICIIMLDILGESGRGVPASQFTHSTPNPGISDTSILLGFFRDISKISETFLTNGTIDYDENWEFAFDDLLLLAQTNSINLLKIILERSLQNALKPIPR